MALTPKNWASFQHYKDRSPAWIKLHRGLLDDFKFARLPVASRALAPLLWLLASEEADGKITASHDELAFRLRMTEVEFTDAIKPLIDSGFFVSDSDALADCKQDAIPEKEEQDKEEEQVETEKEAHSRCAQDGFEEFWKAYPKRDGRNPRDPAARVFRTFVAAGVDPAAIVAGVKAYAERERERIGTRFIAKAENWLRDQSWKDYQTEPIAPTYTAKLGTPQWEAWRVHKQFTGESVTFMDAQGQKGATMTFPQEWPPGHKLSNDLAIPGFLKRTA